MDNEPYMEVEATGVYEGVLYEDMIETVKKNHKLYCDVIINRFFKEGYKRPLTFVPLWAMSLPLKKGDKVLVKFADNDWSRPYLWREKPEIDEWFWKKWEFPEKFEKYTSQPSPDENFSVQRIGEESFILYCKQYTLFRRNGAFFLFDKNNQAYVQCDKLQAEVRGDCFADVKGDGKLYVKGDAELTVDGDIDITGKKKMTAKITGDVTLTSGGNLQTTIAGSSSLSYGGSADISASTININGVPTNINGTHLVVT
jgi:hypothetical protein